MPKGKLMPDLSIKFKTKIKRVLASIVNLFTKDQTQSSKHLAMAQVLQVKNAKRMPTKKQFLHLPSILSEKEKIIASISLLAIIISGTYLTFCIIGTRQHTIPDIGGTYTEGLIGSPQLINPLYSSTSDVDADLTTIIYSGLMKFDAKQGITTDLAESFTVSEDKEQYTFKIRENAKWHDHEPVLIDDIIFTINAIQNSQYRSPLSNSFSDISVSQVDERTVKFDLKEPSNNFLELMTVGILPSHIWQDISPSNAVLTSYNIKPIGSGPYEFKMLEKDSKSGAILSYTVDRFNNYYLEGPYIESITFKFYPDIDTAFTALQNHNIEGMSYLPIDQAAQIQDDSHIQIKQSGLHEYVSVFFNLNSDTAINDVQVRKALSFTTYKEKIINEVFSGLAKQMNSFILPEMLGYSEEISDVIFDQKYATVILDEAGWILNQETGMREKDEEKLSFTLTTLDATELQSVAEMIKSQWAELGVQIEIKTVNQTALQSEILKDHDYDILLLGEVYGNDLDPYGFWHSSQTDPSKLNLAQYENDEVDELLETARETQDNQVKIDSLIEAQKLICADYPAIFLYQPQYTYAISENINGADMARILKPSDRLSNINSWFIKTKKSFSEE
jgi:peptide/nickel transport system substrate-binding protein